MTIQDIYQINPQLGYVGAVAEDAIPAIIRRVPVQVPANGRNPRPGDQVYWDRASNGAAAVTSADEQENAFGIVTYFEGQLGEILSSKPSGANSDTFVEYKDGDWMPVVLVGSVWLLAGAALEFMDRIIQSTADRDYVVAAPNGQWTNVNEAARNPVHCVDIAVADGGIFKGHVGGPVY